MKARQTFFASYLGVSFPVTVERRCVKCSIGLGKLMFAECKRAWQSTLHCPTPTVQSHGSPHSLIQYWSRKTVQNCVTIHFLHWLLTRARQKKSIFIDSKKPWIHIFLYLFLHTVLLGLVNMNPCILIQVVPDTSYKYNILYKPRAMTMKQVSN